MVFFDISVFETTAIIKFCKFIVFSSGSFCQIYRVTDEALIAETMIWPNFFLMNVLFALKGSKLFIIIVLFQFVVFVYDNEKRSEKNTTMADVDHHRFKICVFIPHPLLTNHQKIFSIECFDADRYELMLKCL